MPNEINRPRTRTLHALFPYEPDTIVVEIEHESDQLIAPTVRIPRVTMQQLVFGEPTVDESVGIRAFTDDEITRRHDLAALAAKTRPGYERFERISRDLEARYALTVGESADPAHVRVVARATRERAQAIAILGAPIGRLK